MKSKKGSMTDLLINFRSKTAATRSTFHWARDKSMITNSHCCWKMTSKTDDLVDGSMAFSVSSSFLLLNTLLRLFSNQMDADGVCPIQRKYRMDFSKAVISTWNPAASKHSEGARTLRISYEKQVIIINGSTRIMTITGYQKNDVKQKIPPSIHRYCIQWVSWWKVWLKGSRIDNSHRKNQAWKNVLIDLRPDDAVLCIKIKKKMTGNYDFWMCARHSNFAVHKNFHVDTEAKKRAMKPETSEENELSTSILTRYWRASTQNGLQEWFKKLTV